MCASRQISTIVVILLLSGRLTILAQDDSKSQQVKNQDGPMIEIVAASTDLVVVRDGKNENLRQLARGEKFYIRKLAADHCEVYDHETKRYGWILLDDSRPLWGDFSTKEFTQQEEQKINTSDRLFQKFITESEAGNYSQAIEAIKQSLQIREEILGSDNPEIASLLNHVAGLYRTQGNYAAAEPLDERALKIRKKVYGADHPYTANALENVARIYDVQGKYNDAEPLYQQAVEILEKYLGPENPQTFKCLKSLAGLYLVQGNYSAAEPLFLRVLDTQEKSIGPETLDVAITANTLATTYFALQELSKAEKFYRQALQIKEKVLGPEHAETVKEMESLAQLLVSRRDYPAAENLYQKALSLKEEKLGKEHQWTIETLVSLAKLYSAQSNYDAAEPIFKRITEVVSRSLGAEHDLNLWAMSGLAFVYGQQGKYPESEKLYKKTLELEEKHKGSEDPSVAQSLVNLGDLYRKQGRYSLAEPLLQRALKIREKSLGPDHPETALSLNSLAVHYGDLGNYSAAIELLHRAIKIVEKAKGPGHPDTAQLLNNIAFLYSTLGGHSEAESLYQRALEIRKKIWGLQHRDTAQSINNLALLYINQGKYSDAESLFKQALEICEQIYGSEHAETARAMANVAGACSFQQKYGTAEKLHVRALEIREKLLGPNHPETILDLDNLGVVLARSGEPGKAAAKFDQARRRTAKYVAGELPFLSREEQQEFLQAKLEHFFHGALSFGLQERDDRAIAEQSATWLINGKGITQQALAQQALLIRETKNPKLQPIVQKLLRTRKQLAQLAMSTSAAEQAQRRKQGIDELTRTEAELTQQLVAAGGGDDGQAWVELSAVQQNLPNGGVFIDVARVRRFDFDETGISKSWLPPHYVVWITTKDHVQIVDLGLASKIDAAIKVVTTTLAQSAKSDSVLQAEGDVEAMERLSNEMAAVANLVWKPIVTALPKGTDELIISPDGALWLLPWAALPTGEDKVLLEDYTLRLEVSGRELVKKKESSRKTRSPLIFADPDYDLEPNAIKQAIKAIFPERELEKDEGVRGLVSQTALQTVGRLPGTRLEAKAIAPNLQKVANREPVQYLDKYALESVIKRVKNPSYLMLSTHGFFFPDQKTEQDGSAGFAASETRSVALLSTDGQPIENPLLRCGLLFAGCNSKTSIGGDEGILTGMEVVGMDLRGTEMVVLSACETGVGQVNHGEGVAGLRQAFQLAGAQSVVATLWQVPDRDSALIMNDFFKNLAAGQSRTEALRNAQLKRIESRRERYGAAHPFYWAAWTITGR